MTFVLNDGGTECCMRRLLLDLSVCCEEGV
jgi:hypothetical protein